MTPNPGSKEAIEQGCICARLDNCNGEGYMGTGHFIITKGCKLHWDE